MRTITELLLEESGFKVNQGRKITYYSKYVANGVYIYFQFGDNEGKRYLHESGIAFKGEDENGEEIEIAKECVFDTMEDIEKLTEFFD